MPERLIGKNSRSVMEIDGIGEGGLPVMRAAGANFIFNQGDISFLEWNFRETGWVFFHEFRGVYIRPRAVGHCQIAGHQVTLKVNVG